MSFAGAAPCGTKSCCTTARTTPAVPSGRKDRRLFAFGAFPSSTQRRRFSPEMAVNISLDTTSVASPMPRTKSSVCSMMGVSMGKYP